MEGDENTAVDRTAKAPTDDGSGSAVDTAAPDAAAATPEPVKAPTIGRTVLYRVRSREKGEQDQILHNGVKEGDQLPAIVVRSFTPGSTSVNLRVLCDGNADAWVTSCGPGDEPGQWSWPPLS